MVRVLLLNRYSITFGSIALLALLLNLYVIFNDDGILTGRVVGPNDQPIPGAKVTLFEKTLFVAEPRMATLTDENGEFEFSGHKYHRIWLEVRKAGSGVFPKTEYRLYFKGQNKIFEKPFRLVEEQ